MNKGGRNQFRPAQLAPLQVQRQLGDDQLIEADTLGLGFAGQGGVERLGYAHIELAAELPPLRTDGRVWQAVDETVDLPALRGLGKRHSVLGPGKQACEGSP